MRRCHISLLLGLLLPAAAWAQDTPVKRFVYVQPLGRELPDEDVELVRLSLTRFYALDVRVLPRVALPKRAWYKPRRRYRAEKLLDFLAERMPDDGYRILGLTGVDISTTKGKVHDWGILGLATLDGAACVISKYRCRPKKVGEKRARIRLAKVAVHEIGHTLGLEHCPTRGCLMEDARGKVATCDREYDVCRQCRERLRRWGRGIPDGVEIPWPRPR